MPRKLRPSASGPQAGSTGAPVSVDPKSVDPATFPEDGGGVPVGLPISLEEFQKLQRRAARTAARRIGPACHDPADAGGDPSP